MRNSRLEFYSRGVLQSGGTREAIVQAAVACAAAGDWEGTSLQAVRQRAGLSNGSLFHYFPTRQDLTTAVVAAALQDHHRVLLAELSADAEAGVTAVVRRHLQWVQDNAALARLLLGAPAALLRAAVPETALEDNRRFFTAVSAWLGEHGWTRTPQLRVVVALWIGPAQECSRLWLAEPDAWPLLSVGDDLAAGAWAALQPLLRTGNRP